jgi:hypothetical protein
MWGIYKGLIVATASPLFVELLERSIQQNRQQYLNNL